MQNIFEILGKIGFDWQVALANLVNFLVIFFILKRFAFKPIKKIIQERQNKINQGLENAQKAESDLMMADVKRDEIVKHAENNASLIIAEAAKHGEEVMDRAEKKAQQEAIKIMAQAAKTNEQEFQKMQKELKEKSINLVLRSTEKLLMEKMNDDKNEEYIKKLLKSAT